MDKLSPPSPTAPLKENYENKNLITGIVHQCVTHFLWLRCHSTSHPMLFRANAAGCGQLFSSSACQSAF
jgi:hypothetical protein